MPTGVDTCRHLLTFRLALVDFSLGEVAKVLSEWIRLLAVSSIGRVCAWGGCQRFWLSGSDCYLCLPWVGFSVGEVAKIFSWVDQMQMKRVSECR